jgi:uncharacterized protein YabE (DUF348 family)
MRKPKSKALRRRDFLIRSYVVLLSLILVLSMTALLSQTAFATTYVINDGERVVTYTSFATDPAEVLDQAGVPLEQYDTYTTEAVDGGSSITVNRAQRITVHYRGQTREVASFGETVEQLLHRLGLELTGEDLVSHGLEEKLRDGMVLTVKQALTRQETFSSVITHDTQYRTDPELPAGTEKVLVPGQDGELLRTAEITYINGRETRRVILSEDVLRHPVAEVVAVGSGKAEKESRRTA